MVRRVNSHIAKVQHLAEALRTAAQALGADTDTADDLERAMVEAATNIVRHGYPDDQPGPIKLTVSRRGDTMRVDLLDRGAPVPKTVIDSLKTNGGDSTDMPAPPPFDSENMDLDALPEGGMGLFLIGASVDRVAVDRRRGVNRFRMIKSLPP